MNKPAKLIALLLLCLAVASCARNNALIDAARKGDTATVSRLLNSGANVNAQNNGGWRETALMNAAEQGHTDIVNALISAGADVNAQSSIGRTALMFAAYEGHTEIANMLRAAGAR